MTQTDILITTYQSAYVYKGGGEREILQLQQSLTQSGYLADLYGPQSRSIRAYDTIIHFSLSEDSAAFLHQMRKNVSKMILWPNFWVLDPISEERQSQLQQIVNLFDAIVFKSRAEFDHFTGFFRICNIDVIFVNPGIPEEINFAQNSSLFKDVYGLDKYIIWPGIIEPQKNQLTAIKALSGCGIPLVFSGDVRDRAYLQLCKENAGGDVLFLPDMPYMSEIHLSALMNSEIFLELPLDFPGISAIEAVGLGCNVITTDCTWSREIFDGDVTLLNPYDINIIKKTVELKLNTGSTRVDPSFYNKHKLPTAFAPLMDYLSG